MRPAAPEARASPSKGLRAHAARRFAEAVERAGLVERTYAIAGRTLRIRFAGEAMVAPIGRALEHLSSDGGDGLSVHVWDSHSTGVAAPLPVGRGASSSLEGPAYYAERDGVRVLDRWGTLSVLDAAAAEAWFWAPAPTAMASWDSAAPLRAILHWWLGELGILQLHAGAVGTSDRGLLLVGRGGSGKSTTALAAVVAGLRYAGDDYVAVEPAPEPVVHSLYSTAKLEPEQLARFPALGRAVANSERASGEKAVVLVGRSHPGAPTARFPLAAVLVPRLVLSRPETRAVPLAAPAALTALAPSTLLQLHPPQPHALAEMARLVRRVPCFALELGSDVARIADALAGLLEE